MPDAIEFRSNGAVLAPPADADRLWAIVERTIKSNPGGADPVMALISVAGAMARQLSPRQRRQVVQYLRGEAKALAER